MRDLKNMQATSAGPASKWMRLRVSLLGVIFFVLLVGVFARAWNLQVHQKDRLKAYAEDQYVRAMEIPARRGEIVDRRGVKLASSVDVDSVWIDPSMLTDPRDAARKLAKALSLDARELHARFEKARRFAWVKRQVTDAEAAKVKALNLPGIGFAKEPRRFYPQRELAAHVVGLVGTDSHGLDGLELSFEDELSGERVKREGFRDAKGRKLLTNGVEDPQSGAGASLTLTIDSTLQYVTERALEKAVVDSKATAGMAVVMDPRTGEILSLANWPRFNPNLPQGSSDAFRDRAVTDLFEPGSTFKSFVIASALDEKVISEGSEFDCEKGAWRIGGRVVHDTHPHGVLTPRGILQVSSNICTAKVAQKLGREKLVETFRNFGFGEKYGLLLPGEGKGATPYPRAEIALATQSFGQGISATAVQVAAGYAALANDGVLMKPYLVSKVVDSDGLVLLENKPTPVRRVVSAKAARSVVSMLESVVEQGGTATRARMDEYRVAGKTGTAQKVDPIARGYSDKRVASFVGIVPAEAPRAVILVVIDEPKTDTFGGLVAAPAFKEIATVMMPHVGAPKSREMPVAQAPEKPEKQPEKKSAVVAGIEKLEQMDAVTEEVSAEGAVRVPDVKGLTGRVAVAQLLTAGVEPHLAGSGRVVSQKPAAGSLVEKGTRITLELAGDLNRGTSQVASSLGAGASAGSIR
ncbi:MAG: penicillin-binding protein [Myxococcota bacterium]